MVTSTIGNDGFIRLQDAIREHYGLTPDRPFRIIETKGGILIVPLTDATMDAELARDVPSLSDRRAFEQVDAEQINLGDPPVIAQKFDESRVAGKVVQEVESPPRKAGLLLASSTKSSVGLSLMRSSTTEARRVRSVWPISADVRSAEARPGGKPSGWKPGRKKRQG